MASTSSTGTEPEGQQSHLAPRTRILQLDGLTPGFALAGAYLAQIQHLALRHAP
jgi:hypothetical protein